MSRSLTQVRPDAGQIGPDAGPGGMAPARVGEKRPRETGTDTLGTRALASYGEHMMAVSVWRRGAPRASVWRQGAPRAWRRQQAPRASFRQRVQAWRARNWRRAVLAWFVTTLAIMAIAAEPSTDFPKAQAHSVPAVRVVLRVVEVLTLAGVPVLLIVLP
jgi:hypothetical protein